MREVSIRVLGPFAAEVSGRPVHLTPSATAVLIRLLMARGELMTVDELFRDVWPPHRENPRRENRIIVQKRILELRRALDPDRPGETSEVLLTKRGRVSAYQLVVPPERVDAHRFDALVAEARRSDPVSAVELLTRALALWRGRPLFDVEHLPFAAPLVRRLTGLHDAARRALVQAYRDVGRFDDAMAVAESAPHDEALAGQLAELRQRLRGSPDALRFDVPALHTTVRLVFGDLLAQDDAHLAVGFSDTFDTATERDVVISSRSLQGQLVLRCYAGDRARLDRELRGRLRAVAPIRVETRAGKRQGKLSRYPIGTVAPLQQAGRRIFAVAYSRMGNDLVASSTLEDLGVGLDRLWDAVSLHGQLRPVAVPLIGSGLARIRAARREDLLMMLIRSFLARAEQEPISRELRIVLPEADAGRIDLLEVGTLLRAHLQPC